MRTRLLVMAALVAAAFPASAAATVVNVRIEGRTATLFEGPIETGGRNVQAVSERATGTIHKCDGTNGGANGAPVATPTASAVDAMSIVGQGFEGRWNPSLEDYFVRGFGPDLESGAAYWGLTTNGSSSSVGGCQKALGNNADVLWVYDAFRGHPYLSLSGPTSVAANGAASYAVGRPGISIAGNPPVPAATTDGSGNATVQFGGDGWYRLKADASGYIRSPRLYVCVGACGPEPADRRVRIPPPPVFYGPGGAIIPGSSALAQTTARVRVSRPRASASAYPLGRIAVRWRITQNGVGLRSWTIASRDLSATRARWVKRAAGSTQTSARLRLPGGRSHALRFTYVDRMGRAQTVGLGTALAPLDERSRAVRRTGPWTKGRVKAAWKRTVLHGRRGASLRVVLRRGRPALLLRGRRAPATLAIGGRRVTVKAAKRGSRRVVYGARRSRAGRVTARVLRGRVDLDGVAVAP